MPTTKTTRACIKARLDEGFVFDDFVMVITKKVFEWSRDPTMVKYLRPETLFGAKFDRYLNEPWTDGALARASPTDIARMQVIAESVAQSNTHDERSDEDDTC